MLHDLYLLSCYFEPTEAVLYEDELRRRYPASAIREALAQGLVEFARAPCRSGRGGVFCRLTTLGASRARAAIA